MCIQKLIFSQCLMTACGMISFGGLLSEYLPCFFTMQDYPHTIQIFRRRRKQGFRLDPPDSTFLIGHFYHPISSLFWMLVQTPRWKAHWVRLKSTIFKEIQLCGSFARNCWNLFCVSRTDSCSSKSFSLVICFQEEFHIVMQWMHCWMLDW